MRHFFHILAGLIFTIIFNVLYADTSKENNLDTYFSELKLAKNEQTARTLENHIWNAWFQSGNVEVDTLINAARKQKGVYDFNGAIALINKALDIMPDYSEAWNQRATVHFHQEKYEQALEDIAITLELEPRHFGALAGRAVIRLHQNKPALARQNIIEALKLNPYLKERSLFPGLEIN